MTKELSRATNRTFNRLPPAPAASVVAVGAGAALRSVYYGGGKGGGGPGGFSPGTARTVALTASAVRARSYAAAARAAFCGTAAHMGESKAQGVDLAAIGHGALDLLGFIPGIGAAADVANGLWYAAEGNYVDAAMSFVSAIPGVGDAAGAAKLGAKAGLAALDTADAAMAATRASKKLEAVKLGCGAYKDVRAAGREAHHMPAKSVSHLGEREGPAISMTPEDHRLTASWGNSKAAQDYRKEQQRLVDEGRFREAQQQDIDDMRKIASDKYDREISQMIAYTDELERKGRI